MNPEEHYRKLERLYASAPINEFYKPRIRISCAQAEISVKIKPDFFHAAQAVHGSVYFKSLDDSAFFAVNSLVFDVLVLTASFNIYLTHPISDGEMTAVGKVVHQSRRLFIAESVLFDSNRKEIARGSGSFMRSAIPLSEEMGYK